MRVEHLVATMRREDCAFLDAMRLAADAVVVNQCDRSGLKTLERNGRRVLFWSLPERGIGRSRNRALERATGDILLFSDDDIVYEDGYVEALLRAFRERPDADAVVFNLRAGRRKRRTISRPGRVRWHNYMRYGAARIAVLRRAVQEKGLAFSTEFGGGARYGSGEDTLFLRDCLRSGLKVYAVPLTLAGTEDSGSTWFSGYDDKFFFDKGALFAALNGGLGPLNCLIFLARRPDILRAGVNPLHAFGRMLAGWRAYREEKKHHA